MSAIRLLIENANKSDLDIFSYGIKLSKYYLDYASTDVKLYNKLVDNLSKLNILSEVSYQTIVCNSHGQVKNLTTGRQLGKSCDFISENPFPHVMNILRKTYYKHERKDAYGWYISILCVMVGDETRNMIVASKFHPV